MGDIFSGVRIVEFGTGISAPYATMFLADHGADVIKVEPPNGDPYRAEAGFQTLNRGKRSVVVPDADELARLLAGADVVVVDRPGEAERVRALAPGAVVVAMPPWGEHGPRVNDPATNDLVAAATGLLWQQQSYAEVPVHLVVPMVAYATGILGAVVIAAGLYARERHGWTPTYEVSQVAGSAALQLEQFRVGDAVEERDGSSPMGSLGRVPIYRLFRAGDDRWFFLACGTPRFYERMLDVIGRPELRDDPRLVAPPWGLVALDAVAFIAPLLEEVFATRPRAEWLAAFRAADVPAQPVQSREEFVESELCRANDMDVTVDHPELGPVRMMGVPLVCEDAPGRVRGRAPLLAEHTAELLAEEARPLRPAGGPGDGRGPLHDVRAVDLASFIAGPVATRHLAMLGADVIKVEAPAGDAFRAFGPPFAAWNQGKRSVVLDLGTAEGQAALHRIARTVDVVVENFRPGVATRLGADAPALHAVNPDLVLLSSPGYGDDASMADAPAFDPLLQALGGIMQAQGGDDDPVFLTIAIHDVMTPTISAFGLVAALFHRARTGRAQRVRTSLARTTMAVQVAEYTRFAGAPPTARGGWDHPGPLPERGCIETDAGWEFVDGEHRVPIVRTGIVNEAIAVDNGLLVTHDHPEWGSLTAPGQLVVGAGDAPGRGPRLGEHTDDVLREIGAP
ncbi:MAG: hypothetical protein FJW83_00495 [Actinobacteria bacterium]|nr:hypothetical protein [Actinomycetota bacterium]